MIGDAAWRFKRKWRKAAEAAPAGPLADFYAAGPTDLEASAAHFPLVALDLETDGLEFQRSAIIEAGLIGLQLGERGNSGLYMAQSARIRMRPLEPLSEASVIIHQIRDVTLVDAISEEDALAELLPLLAGKAIVAHFSEIEASFLDMACKRVYGAGFVAPFICTMQLEQRWFPRQRAADGLRLGKLRSSYNLPPYRAHDGLNDAIACGELFLAQWARKADYTLRLRHLTARY